MLYLINEFLALTQLKRREKVWRFNSVILLNSTKEISPNQACFEASFEHAYNRNHAGAAQW